MTDTLAERPVLAPRHRTPSPDFPVGAPVPTAWREDTLTRAKELDTLRAWLVQTDPDQANQPLWTAIRDHLEAAKQAAEGDRGDRRVWASFTGSTTGRAMSNLDAAEANLLRVAPPSYLLGQLPSLLNHVQRHLTADDTRRQQLERLVEQLSPKGGGLAGAPGLLAGDREFPAVSDETRTTIVSAVRAASKAALREQLRVRSFRNVLIVTSAVMTLIAIGVAVLGFVAPAAVPLCFQPEKSSQTVVVCPTQQSALLQTGQESGPAAPDVDDVVKRTAGRADLLVVELIGLMAAAVAAATALRGIRGSSEPYGLPVALATLKLPMGAVTAVLGLLLMRGQFVPGLSALDTSAQILAWALVFGYAQQLFTRLVDQQAHTVLNTVREKKGAA